MNSRGHVLQSIESVRVAAARSSEATDESECTGTSGRRFPAYRPQNILGVGPSTGNSQTVHNFSTSPLTAVGFAAGPEWSAERAHVDHAPARPCGRRRSGSNELYRYQDHRLPSGLRWLDGDLLQIMPWPYLSKDDGPSHTAMGQARSSSRCRSSSGRARAPRGFSNLN